MENPVTEFTEKEREKLFSLVDVYFLENVYRSGIPLKDFLEYLERTFIVKALEICNGNQKNTARLLKLKQSTLNVKIKRYGITVEKRPYVNLIHLEETGAREERITHPADSSG